MTQIIGFAGRKQAGKNTACNFILAMKLAELAVCAKSRLGENGSVEVTDIFEERVSGLDWCPLEDPFVNTKSLFDDKLGAHIKIYAFADKLKRFAIEIFGLDESLVYGTDADKNSKTFLKWQDMPESGKKKGTMTVREVLQYVGTDVFRKMYKDIWVDSCIRDIKKDSPDLALVCDVRFENEIIAIQNEGGTVIGLTRFKEDDDEHKSESEIAKKLSLCDAIVDNSKLTIAEQNEKIYGVLKDTEFIPTIVD